MASVTCWRATWTRCSPRVRGRRRARRAYRGRRRHESGIGFETAVGRGVGHLRLRDGKAWTLLTTMYELKGHEEPGPTPAQRARSTASTRTGRPGSSSAAAGGERTRLHHSAVHGDHRRRPGRHRPRRPAAAARRADHHRRAEPASRRQLAQPLQVALPARPGLVRPPAVHRFPKHWPVFSPKDKIGDWLEMYAKVMELNYWGSTECKSATYDEDDQEWTVVVERDGEEVTLRPKQLVLATGMSGKPNMPEVRGHGRLQGRPAPFLQAPRPRRLRGQEGRRHRLQQLRPRHLRRTLGGRRRRHDGAALVHAHLEIRTLMEIGARRRSTRKRRSRPA